MSNATQDKKNIPPGWGEDPLSAFIDNAQHNTYATFQNLKPQYNLLKNIHQVFDTVVHNLDRSPDWFAAFFLFRSHSAFLEGVRLVLSGAIPESYMVLRGCLENAFYGFYLNGDHQRQETWLRRHDDEKSKAKVRKEFAIRNVLDFLKSKDEGLFKVSNELYERAIDLGAHPNERAFLSVMKQRKDESEIRFDSAYLIGNEPALQLGIKSSAQIGICALLIFQKIFEKRFELLGLSEQINHLKKGL
jgi:hypothetical protein